MFENRSLIHCCATIKPQDSKQRYTSPWVKIINASYSALFALFKC